MRQTALLLALILTAAALAACGKGGYTVTTISRAPSSTAGAPSTGPTGRNPAPAKPQSPSAEAARRAGALAYVHAVNLTAADVPGFTPTRKHESESPAEKRLEQQLARCLGAPASSGAGGSGRSGENTPKSGERSSSGTLAQASSPNFELHRNVLALTVSSEVSVARSSAQVVNVKVDTGTPPAPGVTGGFAWRVTATLGVHGVELPFYFDILGFIDGPAQVTLTSTGTLQPFPAAAQEQLYTQLLARARSHTP